jgi:hypothetical protein
LSARTVGVDETGRIYVLDTQNDRVVIFSTDGSFESELGRHGEGPGELSSSWGLAVSPEGEASVLDFSKRRLVQYAPDGTYSGLHPFPFYPLSTIPRHFEMYPRGYVVLTRLPRQVEETEVDALLLVQGQDTTTITAWESPRTEMVMYDMCRGGLNLPRLFEVEIPWALRGSEIVSSSSTSYLLEVHSGPDLIRRFSRDLPQVRATEALAAEMLGEGMTFNFGAGPCLIPAQDMIRGRGFAEYVPWVQQITISPSGEIWVQREDPTRITESVIDLFGSEGEYLGTLPDSTPFPLVFLSEDRFGAAETDAYDIIRLVVYQVVRD